MEGVGGVGRWKVLVERVVVCGRGVGCGVGCIQVDLSLNVSYFYPLS